MSNSEQIGRRLKFTLVVRDEKDDPSILDIVCVAVEDGQRTPMVGSTPAQQSKPIRLTERHSPIDEKLETDAREAVEEALAKVIEQFQAAGKEPSFSPDKWIAQLSKVWSIIQKAKVAGVELRVTTTDPTASSEAT